MGHHNHHFSGDAFAQRGAWSPPTSAANFCEEDYAITIYIAEFINALSSLAYSYLALRLPGPRRKHDSLSSALFLVGVASTAYHATLRQGPQFSDDIAMLLLGASLLQTLYSHGQTRAVASLVATVVTLGTGCMAIFYVRSGDILLHLLTFSAMVTLIGLRSLYLIYFCTRPAHQRATLARHFWKAAAFLVTAFAAWNVDLEWCHELRAIRHRLGLPWAWALELHGWWHILTALGAAEYVVLVRAMCSGS
ncbi:alkaline phytoceramidase [Immersiella caudata]|uniref:Alkaline phytoceramidase n=1 Tax=Immersiella caudata TaxID=314043 RepID=A0AA40C4E4_9PEZI|nr:alkaline phytoceramidase [Immersiella caudata]